MENVRLEARRRRKEEDEVCCNNGPRGLTFVLRRERGAVNCVGRVGVEVVRRERLFNARTSEGVEDCIIVDEIGLEAGLPSLLIVVKALVEEQVSLSE